MTHKDLKTAVRELFDSIGVDPAMAETVREELVQYLSEALATHGANLDSLAYEQEQEAKRWGDDDSISRATRNHASAAYAASSRLL